MTEDSPKLYLINMSKDQRKGKIFLDYLRNDKTSTAVAPLPPRARKGAPVSMPVTWAQVKSGLDPMRFTIRTAPALIRGDDGLGRLRQGRGIAQGSPHPLPRLKPSRATVPFSRIARGASIIWRNVSQADASIRRNPRICWSRADREHREYEATTSYLNTHDTHLPFLAGRQRLR